MLRLQFGWPFELKDSFVGNSWLEWAPGTMAIIYYGGFYHPPKMDKCVEAHCDYVWCQIRTYRLLDCNAPEGYVCA